VHNRQRSATPLLILLVITTISIACSRQTKPWNVLVITLDTTRADRIGCYGRENASTPVLDSLAAEGFLFERCHSTNPITTPSHSSIMTGKYPMLHGVRDNGLFTLPDERTTLAEVFRENGWATAAAVASFPLTRRFGLDQGFDFFDDQIEAPYLNFRGDRIVTRQKLFFDERPAVDVNQAIIPWLKSNIDRPFFVWVHYFDAHQPFVPPNPYDELFARDLYQGEIAYADESLGRILAVLEERKVADRTLVVVVGDHGEGLGEHDELTHSLLCYETTIRVPLIIKVPGSEGGIRIVDNVGTVDLAPTILDLMDLPTPDGVQGVSLRSYLDPGSTVKSAADRMYYAETLSPRIAYGWSEVRVLIDEPFKYIHSSRPELYDLRSDPSERHDLSAERPDVVESMRHQLEEFVGGRSSPAAGDAAGEVDAETLQRLAALGYIAGLDAPISTTAEEFHADGVAPQDRAGDVSRWSAAKNLIFSKNYLDAREIAQELVDDDPDNQLYLTLLAISQFSLGQNDQALATLERSQSLISQAADLYLAIGRSLMARDEVDRAVRLVESVVSTYPSTDGFFTLAGMHLEAGDRTRYRSALMDALDLDPSFAPARVALAVEAALSGDLETSEAELKRALEDGPLYPPAHFNLGKVLLDAGRATEALSCFDRARSLNSGYWNAYLGLIAAHVQIGGIAAATEIISDLDDRGPPQSVLDQAAALMEVE
jgi:arylsulfatase A-like enzyme/Flp pilus assembly protein TadD